MTVAELIEQLQALPDKSAKVVSWAMDDLYEVEGFDETFVVGDRFYICECGKAEAGAVPAIRF